MRFLRFWSLFTISAAVPLASPAQAANERPNIVLIMADDVGYECFGPYGSKQYSTPRLDKLADTGVRFTHFYSTPLCTPSRVKIMTGKSNARNYVDFGVLNPGEYTFVDLFKKAGYATAVAGKWQLQGSANVAGTPPSEAGFDSYLLWNTPITERRRYWDPSLDLNGKIKPVREDEYGPDIFTDFLIDFMARNRDRPFFAYYPMALVHSPFVPTPDSEDRESADKQKNFEDMVAYADKMIGKISDAIDRLGLREKTILIFTSDNGTHAQISSQLNGRAIQGGKGTPTDAGTRAPLIVHAPGRIPGARVVDDLVDFGDFLATLADMIGAQLPADLEHDGRSFWPQARGEKGNPREWLYGYYFPRPYTRDLDGAFRHPEVRYARDKKYKLYGDGRLFDLAEDVLEKRVIPSGEGGSSAAAAARAKLQAALDSMPVRGAKIPR